MQKCISENYELCGKITDNRYYLFFWEESVILENYLRDKEYVEVFPQAAEECSLRKTDHSNDDFLRWNQSHLGEKFRVANMLPAIVIAVFWTVICGGK